MTRTSGSTTGFSVPRSACRVLLVHVAGDPSNGAALASSIATFKQDNHASLIVFKVLLNLEQLGLERLEFFFTPVAFDCLFCLCFKRRILFCQRLVFLDIILQTECLTVYLDLFGIQLIGHSRLLLISVLYKKTPGQLRQTDAKPLP